MKWKVEGKVYVQRGTNEAKVEIEDLHSPTAELDILMSPMGTIIDLIQQFINA